MYATYITTLVIDEMVAYIGGKILNLSQGKVIEKTLPRAKGGVLGIVPFGGPKGTVTELLFEKKELIPAVQQLLICLPA